MTIDTDAATPWTEGLGFFIDRKNPALFAHNGWNWAFQGIVVMLANNGKGVAIMTNSDNGFALSDRLISSVTHGLHKAPIGRGRGGGATPFLLKDL
jgi:hypothetical protein